MAVIGKLTKAPNSNDITGIIRTLETELRLVVSPNPDQKPGEANSPACVVYADAGGGELVQIGAAWRKTTHDAPKRDYLSAAIDDPSFRAPLNFAIFPGKTVGEYDAVWNRPKDSAGARAA